MRMEILWLNRNYNILLIPAYYWINVLIRSFKNILYYSLINRYIQNVINLLDEEIITDVELCIAENILKNYYV